MIINSSFQPMNVVTHLWYYTPVAVNLRCVYTHHIINYVIKWKYQLANLEQISESVFQNCWSQICYEECYITKHNTYYFPTFCLLWQLSTAQLWYCDVAYSYLLSRQKYSQNFSSKSIDLQDIKWNELLSVSNDTQSDNEYKLRREICHNKPDITTF